MKSTANKIGCVVQGDIRRGTDEVLHHLEGRFDHLVLSTWEDNADRVPDGNFDVLLNPYPAHKGFTHRNYQRAGTDAGIRHARDAGCTHILKWRTDMLPTRLDPERLVSLASADPPDGFGSRLVTCAHGTLTAVPDWFSRIPDFFTFGAADIMVAFWGAEGLDLTRSMNPPPPMVKACEPRWPGEDEQRTLTEFCPESELYAVFKHRLQLSTGHSMDHPEIVRRYFHLVEHEELRICWFAPAGGFRPFRSTLRYPWWTARTQRDGVPIPLPMGYPMKYRRQRFGKKITHAVKERDVAMQAQWHAGVRAGAGPARHTSPGVSWRLLKGGLLLGIWKRLHQRP
jgi:hypothetical protein